MKRTHHKGEIVTAVEIGTQTVKVLIGECLPDRVISLLGAGEEPSLKVLKGEITDAAVVQEQLQKAMVAAEQAAGRDIQNIYLAVTGSHVAIVNSVGSTVINAADHRVTEQDRDSAVRNGCNFPLPPDKRAIHYFERYFLVDGREMENPVGLFGGKLEADVHIVYGQLSRLENSRSMIVEALGTGEREPRDVVFSGIAAGLGVLGPEEVEKGAMVIDFGAGVTEYAVFAGDHNCLHSGQVTVGCEHVANDISLGLRVPVQRAREILTELGTVGSAIMQPDGHTRLLPVETVPGHPPRNIPVSSVERIVEMRLQELFTVILADLQKQDMLKRIGWGIKLAGGGAAIPRITDLAQMVFEMPVEIGLPALVNGPKQILDSPRYATPIGILRYGRQTQPLYDQADSSFGRVLRREIRRLLRVVLRQAPVQW